MTWGSSAAFRFAIVASTRPTSSSRNRSSVLYCPQRMREKLTSGTPMIWPLGTTTVRSEYNLILVSNQPICVTMPATSPNMISSPWSDRTFCDGDEGRWPCPEGLACEGNVCVVPDAKSSNHHNRRRTRRQRNIILIGFGAAIGAALLAVAAWRAWVFGREKRALEDDRSRLVRNQIEDARGQMKDFHAPFCCLSRRRP